MSHEERGQTWARISAEVERFDDGTGKRVDPGIHDLVVGLRAHGCPTFASCEGHLDLGHGRAQPYVDIRLPGAVRPGEETADSYRVVRPMECRMRLALVRLLDAFDEHRPHTPHHARLVVHALGSPGWLHLSTVALDAALELEPREREIWLREGLREARSFASFLKRQFLARGCLIGDEPTWLMAGPPIR